MSDIISITELRPRLYQIFAQIKEGGQVIKVAHRRKVYHLYVMPTNEKVRTPYKKREREELIPSLANCPECNHIMSNGICMNKDCTANQVSAM